VRGRAYRRVLAVGSLLLGMAAAGCSTDETSPSSLCDNEGNYLIAFASDRSTTGHYDIYLFDAESAGFRLLKNLNSSFVSDSSPALSRDGQLIAFVRDPGSTGGADIYMYERISCSIVSLPALNTTGDETEPVFTGDTRLLAFVRDTLGHRRIRMMSGTTHDLVALPGLQQTAAYDDWSPAPDSTGNRIVFVSDREGSPHLYLYDRTEQSVDSLVDLRASGARDLDPTLTPNGLYLCFASDRAGGQGGFDIYLAHLDAVPPVATTLADLNTSGDERHPAIGHSASYIAYQGQRADSTGWNVHYYSRSGAVVISPDVLGRTSSDLQPSVRLP
jgi:Tol biopolymer transport system component